MGQFLEQVGLALGVDNRLHRDASHFAIHHFQLVGEYIVNAQLGLQLLGEVREAAGQDGGLVAQSLEFGEQGFGAFSQAQRRADRVQHAHVQALEQRKTLLEAGTKIQLAGHRALGNLRNLLAHTGRLGQLIDDFGFDQGGVHVEHRQAAVATEQGVFLEGDIDIQFLGHAQEVGAQRLRVSRFTAHGELDAALAFVSRGVQWHATRQTVNMVDIQSVLRGDRTDALQLLSRYLAGQQGDDMALFTLAFDPVLVVSFGHRGETYLLIELIRRKQDVLEYRGGLLGAGDLHQDAERQGVVDHCLADVENVHTTLGQDAGNGCGETRSVFTRDVDQDNFAQSAPPGWKKTAFYPLSVTIGHSQRFAGQGPVAILRVNFTDQEPSASEPAHASKNR